ncbi:MAG: hypothetical protein MUF31_07830 [Akkermansiaceae bacterium]|nr:hypothetical protein [Akkermansiaceae bacterium]
MPTRLLLPILSSLVLIVSLGADDRWAPQAVAGPINQLVVSGNACGPAALLGSLRCGDDDSRAIYAAVPGNNDRSRLLYLIRTLGLRPSVSLRDRARWTRQGINPEDLHAIARELSESTGQQPPRMLGLHAPAGTKGTKTLQTVHRAFRDSLADGFPPVLAIRRYVLRKGQWQMLDGHFISIVRVPERLDRSATSFSLTYFDPWGAKKREASIEIPSRPFLSQDPAKPGALELRAPEADVGKSKVRSGEFTLLAPTVMIGE